MNKIIINKMSKITINFFGEKISINKPKSISSIRNEISKLFFFSPQEAAEIILTYKEKGKKKIIVNENDFKAFLKSKNTMIDLDICQESKIYNESLNQLKKESLKDKACLEELIKKKDELVKLKETKYIKEKKEVDEIEAKIKELNNRKKLIKKKIVDGIKQIEKEIKENEKKISEYQKKISMNNINGICEKKLKNVKSIHYNMNKKSSPKEIKLGQVNLAEAPSSWEVSDETVATGDYGDWRNEAIIYPPKGQLLPAGFLNIKFKALKNAVKYDVYFDYQLIKTFEGNERKEDEYETSIRNNEVKKHTTCVVAILADGTEVISNLRNFYISKKGIGIWQSQVDNIKEMNLTWYYDWSYNSLSNVSNNIEFVPMIWGKFSDNSNEVNWIRDNKWKEYHHLLMFNEPDFPDQANMSPEQAIDRWKYIQPLVDNDNFLVSSPAVAIPTVFYEDENNDYKTVGGWFGKYSKLMAEAKYNDEFTAVHFYFDYPGEWILDIFRKIHETTGKKLWITEWGVAQWSQVQNFDWTGGPDEGNWQREMIAKFIKEILPILDQTDYIERYAWFPFDGSNTEKFGNGAGGLFFNTESDPLYKQLTLAGKAYKESGNPEGWEPNKITEDQVIKKKGDDGSSDNIRQNVLKGKKATASSEIGNNTANKAIDSDLNSRWESQHGKTDEEWIKVDLGDLYIVDEFKVVWEAAGGKEYKIQTSIDDKEWKDVYKVSDGKSGETRKGTFDASKAKYVRLLGISKVMEIYGFSIYDFEVMGIKGTNQLKSQNQKNKVIFKVKCIGCGIYPIKGTRYKCAICINHNYCENCGRKYAKEHSHPFFIFKNKERPAFLNNPKIK